MYTFLKPILVREALLNKGIKIFTRQEFERIFYTPPFKTKYFLEQQVHKGLFLRLKKGLYALKTDLPTEEEIANQLYKPSYISFEYALAYHSILPEMPYAVTSATTKPTRSFSVDHKPFDYLTIQPKAYTGYSLTAKGNLQFLVADPEKALIDYLYFVSLGKKPANDRLATSQLNLAKALQYASLYGRPKLTMLVKQML